MGRGFDVVKIVLESDSVIKLVLVILLFFSVMTWAVIVEKWILLRRTEKTNREFLEKFRIAETQESLLASMDNPSLRKSSFSELYKRAWNGMREHIVSKEEEALSFSPSRWRELVRDNLERFLFLSRREWSRRIESRIGFLATAGNVSPFIGLFGTVWGIMKAFHDIGELHSATLSTVAPGISEALVATAAGLAAAIPAVIGFNYFVRKFRLLSAAMDDFSSEILLRFEREFVR